MTKANNFKGSIFKQTEFKHIQGFQTVTNDIRVWRDMGRQTDIANMNN